MFLLITWGLMASTGRGISPWVMTAWASPTDVFDLLSADSRAPEEAIRIATEAALSALEDRPPVIVSSRSKSLQFAGGAFVTAIQGGRTRGCWGSVYPTTPDLAREIASAGRKAMHADYRHRPIQRREWPTLLLIVSVVRPPRRLQVGETIDPRKEGLFITNGSRGGVVLPKEVGSARRAREICLSKAGLGSKDRWASYAFETWTAHSRLPLKGTRP